MMASNKRTAARIQARKVAEDRMPGTDRHDWVERYRGWWIVQYQKCGKWFAYRESNFSELFDGGFDDRAEVVSTIDDIA